jgi:hypothetical protein
MDSDCSPFASVPAGCAPQPACLGLSVRDGRRPPRSGKHRRCAVLDGNAEAGHDQPNPPEWRRRHQPEIEGRERRERGTDTDPGADSEADSDSGADSGADSASEADSDSEAGADSDSEAGADSDPEAEADPRPTPTPRPTPRPPGGPDGLRGSRYRLGKRQVQVTAWTRSSSAKTRAASSAGTARRPAKSRSAADVSRLLA